MDQVLPHKINGKPRILLAPLDWGLGHATRCIPIIRQLLLNDMELILAGEGAQEELLRAEFPQLPFLRLKGYRISYSKTAAGLPFKMLRQAGRIRKIIQEENNWLKKTVAMYSIDSVISDNRFGLYHEKIPCVFITHQLTIKTGWGKWSERFLQKWNYRYINRFSECWVPDQEGTPNLAGELSHPSRLPSIPVKYIGPLSRLQKNSLAEQKGNLFFIISGPEPQRGLWEEKIIRDIAHYNGHATILRGLPGHRSFLPSTNMISFHNHLESEELNREMEKAEYVISRSGYSTVMDALQLGKKCIFIPTPGQTEQEYLARELEGKHIACYMSQEKFSLGKALEAAATFNYQFPAWNTGGSDTVIKNFIRQLKAKQP